MVENLRSRRRLRRKGPRRPSRLAYRKPIFDIRSDLQERYEDALCRSHAAGDPQQIFSYLGE
ncbi:MAG: hypothetical protein ACLR8Y_21335 [Alistipes indistinctus]